MFLSKIPPKLDTFAGSQVINQREFEKELVSKAVEQLKTNGLDHEKAAANIGLDGATYFELRNKYYREFFKAEELYLAKLETMLYKAALGYLDVEPKYIPSMTNTAKWLLERKKPQIYGKISKVHMTHSMTEPLEVTGKAVEILDRYENGTPLRLGDSANGGEDSVLSSDKQGRD